MYMYMHVCEERERERGGGLSQVQRDDNMGVCTAALWLS